MKHKIYELKNIYNKFKQHRWYAIEAFNSKQIQIFSRTLEIGVQRSLMLPTQVILSKFPTNFSKLIILLIPKYKEFSNMKLDNNDA